MKNRADYEVGGLDAEISVDSAKAKDGIEQIIKALKKLEKECKDTGKVDMAKSIKAFQQEFYKATKGGENLNKLIKNIFALLNSSGNNTWTKEFSNALKNINKDLDKTKQKTKAALSNELSPELNAKLKKMEQKQIADKAAKAAKLLKAENIDIAPIKDMADAMKASIGKDTLEVVPKTALEIVRDLKNELSNTKEISAENKKIVEDKLALTEKEIIANEEKRIKEEQGNATLNEQLRLEEELGNKQEQENQEAEKKKTIQEELKEILKSVLLGYKEATASIKKAKNGTSDLKDKTKETKEETKETKDAWKDIGESVGKIAGFLKGFSITALVKNLATGIARLAKTFVNYADKIGQTSGGFLQTQHMFNTVMGESIDKATEFQKEMNRAFGTNMADTMKYQSYFMQMSSAMGIANKEAYTLSKGLTMLGEDLAGFYGISEESAMEKLRLGLSGQTKSLRSLGLDVTNQTMAPVAQSLGITKSVKNMSQGEKVALRYITILRQTENVQGELAKKNYQLGDSESELAARIETPANQLRVLKQQVQELGISIGNIFLPILQKILPYVNGFVMALKEIANMIATLLGYNAKMSSGFGTGEFNYSEDLGLDDAVDKAKELNKQLGIDELNVLKENDNNASGGFGIDPALLSALEAYDNGMENIRMKAEKIRDMILEWLGFAKTFNEETGEWEWDFNTEENIANLKRLLNILKTIAIVVGVIALTKLVFSIISGITGLIDMNNKLATIGLSLGTLLRIMLGIISIVAGVVLYIQGIMELLKTGKLSWEGWLKVLGGIALVIAGIALVVGIVPALIAGIVLAAGLLIAAIVTNWDALVTTVKNAWEDIKTGIYIGLVSIGAKATEIGTHIKYFFTLTLPSLGVKVKHLFLDVIASIAKRAQDFINNVIDGMGDIAGLVDKLFGTDFASNFKHADFADKLQVEIDKLKASDNAELSDKETEKQAELLKIEEDLKKIIQNAENERDKKKNDNLLELAYKLDEKEAERKAKEVEEAGKADNSTMSAITNLQSLLGNKDTFGVDETEDNTNAIKENSDILNGIKDNIPNFKDGMGIELPDSLKFDGIDGLEDDIDFSNELMTDDLNIDKNIASLVDDQNGILDAQATSTDLSHMTDTLVTSISGVKKACENIRINVTNNYNSYGGGGSSSGSSSSSSSSKSAASAGGSATKVGVAGLVSTAISSVKKIFGFATGGMPESSSLFFANENGAPELVGQIGNRAAVANNQQIVDAVSVGVANAVARTLNTQKDRPIDVHIEVDSREIARANNQGQRKLGQVITGGAFAKG